MIQLILELEMLLLGNSGEVFNGNTTPSVIVEP